MPVGGRGIRVGGGAAILILLVGWLLGADPIMLLNMLGGGGAGQMPIESAGTDRIDDETEEFVAVVLGDTEDVWNAQFDQMGRDYVEPSLVLFSGMVSSACGTASSAVGPFYCPGDHAAYLDTSFFRTLGSELGAQGDFAAAYVIAHEVAHHVQNLLGVTEAADAERRRLSDVEANQLSVRVELQADCLAGVWARNAEARFGSLEPGDVEEAMNAASRIGDDALQRRSQGVVVPDSFTHGTSEQRVRWFTRGFESGSPEACDTFGQDRL
jgi:predicted metalloprotease